MNLSHGFPHYTHILGKYTALHAFGWGLDEITEGGFHAAVERSIEDTYRGIQDYYLQMLSKRFQSIALYLLAAASAPVGKCKYGSFYPDDLVIPLRNIRGKLFPWLPIQWYIKKLASEEGENVLQPIGRPKNRRYRFRIP